MKNIVATERKEEVPVAGVFHACSKKILRWSCVELALSKAG